MQLGTAHGSISSPARRRLRWSRLPVTVSMPCNARRASMPQRRRSAGDRHTMGPRGQLPLWLARMSLLCEALGHLAPQSGLNVRL
jgi:hypothetical protein